MTLTDTAWLIGLLLFFGIRHIINKRHEELDAKIDGLYRQFEGLRNYLYEIDPQFDDERRAAKDFEEGVDMYSGQREMELIRSKQAEGRRILLTPFD